MPGSVAVVTPAISRLAHQITVAEYQPTAGRLLLRAVASQSGVTDVAVMTPVAVDAANSQTVAARLVDRVGRVARAARVPLMDEVVELGAGIIAPRPAARVGSEVGDGVPVLVIGGLASTPATLAPLAGWLAQLGCAPTMAPIRAGFDCGERTMPAIERALERIHLEHGTPPLVVAHSRGGQFARAATVRNPDSVRALITLGSPINRMLALHPLLRIEVGLLSVAGAVGVPGLFSPSCLWGGCCRALRDDLRAPFPAHVPYVSVYSRRDTVVDWRSCLDPAARHREVDASHVGLINSTDALDVLAQEIAHCVRDRAPLPTSQPSAA